MKWIKTNLNLLLSIAFMLMTLTIFGPLELYLTNSSEFWFEFSEMLKISGILTAVAGVVLLVIGLILKGKTRSLYAALVFILALCLYIQGNFLNIDYGLLDGRTIDWSSYTTHAVTNTLMWVACIGLLVFFWVKKPELCGWVFKISAICLMLMQALSLGILFLNTDTQTENNSSRVSTDHIMEIGSGDNIVIFVLDTFDDAAMDALMEVEGERFRTLFKDFTRFTDCAAGGATTMAAMPIIISGEYFSDGDSYTDYVSSAFNADGLYSELKKQGYTVSMYTDSAYIGSGANGYVSNYVRGAGQPNSYTGLAAKYNSFTLFKYMPHILKQFFWSYTAEFNAYRPGESYITDDAAFYNTLATQRLQVTEGNAFRLIHLQGPHYPYTINEFAQPVEVATREQQAKGNLYIVEEYINQMKACGVYEDSMIIVTADHGDSANYAAPILFVKDRGTTGVFQENDAPVSHLDLHATIFSYLGEDNGNTFFEISETEPRDRLFYLRAQEGGSFYMIEYLIQDKVAVVGTGLKTGNQFTPVLEKIPVTFGQAMSLALEGDAIRYIVSGMDTWPLDSVETQGTEALFNFDLGNIVTSDLDMSIEVLRLYDDPRDQTVEIYANGELVHAELVTEPKSLHFTVPASLLTDDSLELKLVLATKWRPLYLSAVTITSDVISEETSSNSFSITDIVAIPLTALMRFCHNLLGNYILAILVFTVLTKIILLPISMWVHKSGITMALINPKQMIMSRKQSEVCCF